MKLKMFSVFDEKAAAFLQPFFFSTVGQAVRAITDCVNDSNHQFSKHASDYTLFEIGKFDDQTGIVEDAKHPLGCLVEYKTEVNNGNLHSILGGTQ